MVAPFRGQPIGGFGTAKPSERTPDLLQERDRFSGRFDHEKIHAESANGTRNRVNIHRHRGANARLAASNRREPDGPKRIDQPPSVPLRNVAPNDRASDHGLEKFRRHSLEMNSVQVLTNRSNQLVHVTLSPFENEKNLQRLHNESRSLQGVPVPSMTSKVTCSSKILEKKPSTTNPTILLSDP